MPRVRVKNVAASFDDDDLDDDYEDEFEEESADAQELSPEDEAQMQSGTIAVQDRLGKNINPPVAEIRETLWYYFYDVPQSVEYLKDKYAPKTPTPSKKARVMNGSKASMRHRNTSYPPPSCLRPLTAAEFFADVPWLRVPPERLGNITVEPVYPRGRLLGGSSKETAGKPSKLAALAASRKRAQEEKKKKAEQESSGGSSTAILDKLGSRRKTADGELGDQARGRTYPKPKLSSAAPEELPIADPTPPETTVASIPSTAPSLTAQPSTFATTLLGSSTSTSLLKHDMLTLPYIQEVNVTNDPFSGPSPDDKVLSAQSKTSTPSKTPKKKGDVNGATQGVAKLKVEENSRIRSKNYDVEAEFAKLQAKNATNFVVIGHVDHGKSTLMGRLLYDMKIVNERSLQKLQKEANTIGKSSFALAWVMDSTPDERSRGVTVDIATNYFETEKTRFTILDAPGHKDFIPNMIAGTSQADFAVLVIDASTNAFESGLRGQTKEHALLARSMGISRVVVAVNKMDNTNWSEARFNEVSQQTSAFLTQAGFQTKNVVFVPCAGLTGSNVVSKPTDVNAKWYTGPSLIEALDSVESSKRTISTPLRFTISDVFRGGPQNTLAVTGRLDSGSLQIGDAILAQPASETGTVKNIEVDTVPMEWCVAGQIATLFLLDIDQVHLKPGDIICSPTNNPISNVVGFTCKTLAFEHLMPSTVDVHRGRTHVPARITALVATLDKGIGEVVKKKPRVVKPGTVATIKVELDNKLPLEEGVRVVLRSGGQTVGAGLVEDIVTAGVGDDGASKGAQ